MNDLLLQWMAPLLARGADPRTPEVALRSPVRRQIMQLVELERCVSLSRVRRDLGLGWGTLYHQLRRMEESGLVRSVRVGKRRFVVSARANVPDPLITASARVQSGMGARVAELIATGAARDVLELAEQTGLSLRAVRYHVRALIDAELVTSASRSRHHRLQPTPLLLAALDDRRPAQEG